MTSTPSTPSINPASAVRYVIDTARQGGDQALALYRQAARFSLEAAGLWSETVWTVVPGGRTPPAALTEALAEYATATFDLAERAVGVQRELVAEVIGLLASH
jgi:hypothetical protein